VAVTQSLSKRLDNLKGRKESLVEAFIYRKAIDQETYEEQSTKLTREIMNVQLELSTPVKIS
jgi:hypothetical protein